MTGAAAVPDAQLYEAYQQAVSRKHQFWERAGRRVAYPGSIGRFHYGEEGDKGYLLWGVFPDESDSLLIPTPSRQTLSIEFDGPPDMARLAEVAAQAGDKFVRIRGTSMRSN